MLPNERLITKIELKIVIKTVQDLMWSLLINWKYNKQPVKHMNISSIKGMNIDDKVKIPEYILALWYWGNSYIL